MVREHSVAHYARHAIDRFSPLLDQNSRVMVIAIYTDSVDPGAMRESVIAQIARSAYDYMLYAK